MRDAVASAELSAGRARHLLFAAMAVTGSVMACLLLVEIVLRFLPVATGMWAMPVNAAHPVFRFTPDREFLFSRGWNFSLVNRGRINNDGFVNDENYAENDSRPLLAVVGDSYVEAAMVPNDKTFYRRQSEMLGGKGRIYSFGASGAPLSQYLIWARHAAQRYQASALAIVVVGNDFDESLLAYNARPGLHVYARESDNRLHLRRIDFAPSSLRHVVRRSALGRYLIFNLKALETARQIAARLGLVSPAHASAPHYVGNTAAEASPQRVRDSQEAIAAFFDDLTKMIALAPDRIVFLVDGARYEAEIAMTETSYFGLMRKHFMREASQRGYEVVDLQPWFLERSRDGRTRFEDPVDRHWNATGHAVVAEALAASKAHKKAFQHR
jgi:hypothetical protein